MKGLLKSVPFQTGWNLITFSECIQKFAKLLIHHPESIMDQRRDVRNSLLIYQSFEILPFVLN